MSTTAIVLVVLVGLVFLVGMLVVLPKAIFAYTRKPLEARIRENHRPEDVFRADLRANFFGIESKGAAQLRGNGALVLTKDALHFYQLVPRRDFRFPLADIRSMELVRSHLGKSVGYKLLKVHFTQDGAADSVAWFVPDPEGWQASIASLAPTVV